MEDQFHNENEEENSGLMEEEENFDAHKLLNEEELKYMYRRSGRKKKNKQNPAYEKAIYIGGASILGLILFLAILIHFTGKDEKQANEASAVMQTSTYGQQQLEDLKSQLLTVVQSNQSLQDEINQLSQENQLLQQEIDELKSSLQSSSQSNSQTSVQTSSNSSQQITSYTVQKGDTLWSISEKIYGNGKYHTKIMEENGLKDTSDLKAGMKLKISPLTK